MSFLTSVVIVYQHNITCDRLKKKTNRIFSLKENNVNIKRIENFSSFSSRKANRANLYFIPLLGSTSRKRQLSRSRGSRDAAGGGERGEERESVLNKYEALQAPTTRLIGYRGTAALRRARTCVACRPGRGSRGRGCDVTYKVATHRRATNAGWAYCLRSRDEPFSRARLTAARLTGRGAVNRTPGAEAGEIDK